MSAAPVCSESRRPARIAVSVLDRPAPRATCTRCGRSLPLRKDGTYPQHRMKGTRR